MAKAFVRAGAGSVAAPFEYVAGLGRGERGLLVTVLGQLADLLTPDGPRRSPEGSATFESIVSGIGSLTTPQGAPALPEDPAVARLIPDGHRSEPELSAEFRRLTEAGLRNRKAEAARCAAEALGRATGREVRLTQDEAQAFASALTDVRLVLAARLGVSEEGDLDQLEEHADTLPERHPVTAALNLYNFLAWLQDSLVTALLGGDDA